MKTSILEYINDSNVSILDKIKRLKTGRKRPLPNIEKYRSQWDVSKHRTMTDLGYLPYRWVSEPTGRKDAKGKEIMRSRYIDVNRLAFPFQKKIVKSKISFALGNPIKLLCETDDANELKVLNALKRIDHDCKLKSFRRKQLRECSRSTEVAEIWYTKPYDKSNTGTKHSTYGFDTTLKVKVTDLSPWEGNVLYPYFDETNDMVVFSREFQLQNDIEQSDQYFELYTDEKHIIWMLEYGTASWIVYKEEENKLKKIPANYMPQEAVEWGDIQWAIERLELLLSKHAEKNDYHASPKVFVEGKIESFVQKGDAGGIIQGASGSKAYYLSWDHATESVKLEIETLLRFIYGFTQTPDISFDSVKGLQAVSGVALELLFMDAHLKVQELREMLDDYLQRQINIQKAFIAFMAPDLKKATENIRVEPEVTPYMVNDKGELIKQLSEAVAAGIKSKRQAIKELGDVDDIDAEMEQIEKEESSKTNIFQPKADLVSGDN